MKKEIFADWLKELCMLVFIQTVQAFIFAIVMSLILSLLMGDYGSSNDVTGAVGIIAIILLAAVSKIEELIKKIFGIKSNVHDAGMRGGLKSLATTMMAASLAKGVLDNGKKFFGGAAGAISAPIKAQRDLNQARARMARDIGRYNNGAISPSARPGIGAGDNGQQSTAATPMSPASATGGAGGAGSSIRTAPAMSAAAASSSGSSNNYDKLQEKIDAYNDRITEIKSKRRMDMKRSAIDAISGISETAGAIGFGAVGMTAGAALGEAKEMFQGGLAGMGAGDKIGSVAVSPIRTASNIQDMVSENRRVNEELKKQVNVLTEQGERIRTVRGAKKELDRQLSHFDAGDL